MPFLLPPRRATHKKIWDALACLDKRATTDSYMYAASATIVRTVHPARATIVCDAYFWQKEPPLRAELSDV